MIFRHLLVSSSLTIVGDLHAHVNLPSNCLFISLLESANLCQRKNIPWSQMWSLTKPKRPCSNSYQPVSFPWRWVFYSIHTIWSPPSTGPFFPSSSLSNMMNFLTLIFWVTMEPIVVLKLELIWDMFFTNIGRDIFLSMLKKARLTTASI